jgi:hypothetical protein
MASIFQDKAILDCSQITLKFAISMEDTSGGPSDKGASTAETSPINGAANAS